MRPEEIVDRLADHDAGTPAFADNFDRVLGLHRLPPHEAARMLGVSAATLSYWRNGRRAPTSDSLRRVCEFFELDMWGLLVKSARELLPDLADARRFERVERRIAETRGEKVVPLRRTRT